MIDCSVLFYIYNSYRLDETVDFAERMKHKALRVRSEGSIPPYVTEAESRKQHSDSPLCNRF